MSPPIDPTDKALRLLDTLSAQTLLRIVTENARVGLVIVSSEHSYVYANTTYAEILGLPSSDLVGLRLQDVLVDAHVPGRVREQLALLALAGGEVLWVPGPGGRRSALAPLTPATTQVRVVWFAPAP